MKNTTLILLFLSINQAFASQCMIREEVPTLYKMAMKVGANCSDTHAKIINEYLLDKCEELAKVDREIKINDNGENKSIRFTQFSESYDVHSKNYFCKNKAGNEALSLQLKNLIQSEINQFERNESMKRDDRNSLNLRPNEIAPWPSSLRHENANATYKCLVSGYGRQFKIVRGDEVLVYRDVMNYTCVEI